VGTELHRSHDTKLWQLEVKYYVFKKKIKSCPDFLLLPYSSYSKNKRSEKSPTHETKPNPTPLNQTEPTEDLFLQVIYFHPVLCSSLQHIQGLSTLQLLAEYF